MGEGVLIQSEYNSGWVGIRLGQRRGGLAIIGKRKGGVGGAGGIYRCPGSGQRNRSARASWGLKKIYRGASLKDRALRFRISTAGRGEI